MTLRSGQRAVRHAAHSVRFNGDEPKYKSLDVTDSSDTACGAGGHAGPHSGPQSCPADSPDACHYQPAAQRLRLNEHRIKLLTSINQVVGQRADLEASRAALTDTLEELRRKLRRRVDDCHADKKDRIKALKAANLRLERDKFSALSETEHLRRHLQREEAHHVTHARTAVTQAIQGVVSRPDCCSIAELPALVSRSVAKHAPSKLADSKLCAARLMRDIAELRQRVAHVEQRLAAQLKRKRQAEADIARLRKQLSATKSCVASLRLPPPPLARQCSKFA